MASIGVTEPTGEMVTPFKPLRIWIAVLLLPLMVVARFIPSLVQNGPATIWMASAFGPFLISFLLMGWWLIASRARWFERLLGVFGIIAILTLQQVLAHFSMRGALLIVMTIPMTVAGFTIGLILLGRRLSISRTWLALFIALICAIFSDLIRTDGVWGNFAFGIDWRWSETAEERLLAKQKASASEALAAIAIDSAPFQNPEWPGFRGPNRDGTQHGLIFSDDWQKNPPKELWRINVGPAWSSFAVAGDYLVTQEQRGGNEAVVCYDAKTGKQVWENLVASRFFESLGGLGPRGTPAIAAGAVYALGAEGWLVKINASNGELVWKVDLRKEASREPPMWGFSASPLVHNGMVIVHAGGKGDKGVLAFSAEDGTLKWSTAAGEQSYGSVQLVTLAGRSLLGLLSETGAHFWEPDTGKNVLDYQWKHQGYRSLQPMIIDSNKVLIPTGSGSGTRLIEVSEKDGELQGKELWTSLNMKPDYNDLLAYNGYVYGFDDSIFACIDLKDGKRKWKKGRYQKGQALLLADSGLIIVVSEQGELVLLRANPEKHEELAKIPALNEKTWNHPVVVGDKLYLRNAEEAVCYQLATSQKPEQEVATSDP